MNNQQYIEQNKLGFEGDTFAKDKMKKLIQKNGIKTVIETGTFIGSTTRHFSEWAEKVHTVELNPSNFSQARNNLSDKQNINFYLGNSSEVLDQILSGINKDELIFCFLDAHWNEYNPLLDELAVIAKHGFRPIIAIHDFKVPHHPELGFDQYGEIVYEWAWIEEAVKKIFHGVTFTVEYNFKATGAKRGIVYLYMETCES